jgi:S-methylmethionine-dependent homocysteine/selenocysteine methylase
MNTRRSLPERLTNGEILLLDGATGTEIERRGLHTYLPLWSALGLIEQPALVRAIHEDYARAGADILTANTFRTTARTLSHAGYDPAQASDLTRLAVRLAKDAATATSRDILIAGSIAPLEDCYSPWLSPPEETAFPEHLAHARNLAAAGVDFLMVETMPVIDEAAAAARAALTTGLPVTVGFVLGDDGRLLSGETLAEAVQRVAPLGICAILVNCSPPETITQALHTLRGLTHLPIGGYANLGTVDNTVGWRADEQTSGPAYAAVAEEWLRAGAQIIGGCCGTRPEHIAALRELLDRYQAQPGR